MAIDPPYRFDPFQNLVNVRWNPTPSRRKLHFTIYNNMAVNATWVTDHWESTYGDGRARNGTIIPSYWIWLPENGAPSAGILGSAMAGDYMSIYSDGCTLATRDLNALFSTPDGHLSGNYHLDGSPSFGSQNEIGTFLVTWDCWKWSGFNETLIEGDPNYVPEDQFITLDDYYYGPLYYGDFLASNWGEPRLSP